MLKRLVPVIIKQKLKYQFIYKKFSPFTMVSKSAYLKNLKLAEKIKYIEGDVVECGVWKGGMIAGIAELLNTNKTYYLFDSFEGLPPAQQIDGTRALEWQNAENSADYHNNCKADLIDVEQAMSLLKNKVKYEILPGWFEQTLQQYSGAPIALLRLDADWYDSTLLCLEKLFDYVVPQGIIIIDDYYTWDGCSRAVHDFLSKNSLPTKIRIFDNTICWIKK